MTNGKTGSVAVEIRVGRGSKRHQSRGEEARGNRSPPQSIVHSISQFEKTSCDNPNGIRVKTRALDPSEAKCVVRRSVSGTRGSGRSLIAHSVGPVAADSDKAALPEY